MTPILREVSSAVRPPPVVAQDLGGVVGFHAGDGGGDSFTGKEARVRTGRGTGRAYRGARSFRSFDRPHACSHVLSARLPFRQAGLSSPSPSPASPSSSRLFARSLVRFLGCFSLFLSFRRFVRPSIDLPIRVSTRLFARLAVRLSARSFDTPLALL